MTTVRLAFYKKRNSFFDKAIMWYTKSKYSHVELLVGDIAYSSSVRDKGVRKWDFEKNANKDNWDIVEIDEKSDLKHIDELYTKTKESAYDLLGILLSQMLPIGIHAKSSYFCSEWCAEALKINNPHKFSPEDLYRKFNNK